MKLARTLGLTKLATGIVAASISVLAMTAPALSAERIKAEWWHALRGRLTPIAEELVTKFNASQDKYEIKAVLKGTYEESQAAMVAAYRVKQHPVLMQTSERTFLTMYKSGAVNLVSDFMQEQGYTIDWSNFVPPVAGYYLVDGKPAAYVCRDFVCQLPVTDPAKLVSTPGTPAG